MVWGLCFGVTVLYLAYEQRPLRAENEASTNSANISQKTAGTASATLEHTLGIEFVQGSTSSLVIKRNGKKYVVDVARRTIREIEPPAKTAATAPKPPVSRSAFTEAATLRKASSGNSQPAKKQKRKLYSPGDDVVFTLPTGRPIAKHGLYVNFAHRFPYFATFSDQASGGALGGLDGTAFPSFGFRFGITDRLSASIYREPSLMGRPIQFLGQYNLLEEEKGRPFNMAVGFAVQGQNNFSKNYTESLEGIFSRSISSRAQLYIVPTLSFNNRPLQQVTTFLSSGIPSLPGHNTFSLGVGGSLDIRPTVALVAEVIPTLANGRPMGILRPAVSFGIQKKIWRHAFTFGWTTAPGVMVSERAGTRASFLGQPNADTLGGLFIGFDVTRRLF